MLQMIRELCGSGILMSPGETDMNNSEVATKSGAFLSGRTSARKNAFAC